MIDLPDSKNINHIVVFLTNPLPFGYATTIHFDWPGKPWTLLGYVSNDKPSAIFKVGGKKEMSTIDIGMDMMEDSAVTAQLGLSIDLLANVEAAVSTLSESKPLGTDMAISVPSLIKPDSLSLKILENLYNYCASFSTTSVPINSTILGKDLSSTYLPLKVFQDWYNTILRKLSSNPGFLDN